MKKYLLALAAAVTCAGPALAADLPARTYTKAPAAVAPVATWTGCYVGGGVGYGLWDQENTDVDTFGNLTGTSGTILSDTSTTGGKGWLGRIGAGCDYQFGVGTQQLVIGAFGDYDWTNIKGQVTTSASPFVGRETMNNQWAVGGRIGWVALPNLMTFVSAGYTQAHFNGTTLTSNNFFFDPIGTPEALRDAATYKGWFVGGGDEYAFNWFSGLFWKTEYRLSEFDTKDVVIRDLAGDPAFTQASKKWVQTITSSLVYRFNFSGVPSAWH
jgi:outer membrane immunogenic protein